MLMIVDKTKVSSPGSNNMVVLFRTDVIIDIEVCLFYISIKLCCVPSIKTKRFSRRTVKNYL